MTLKDKIQQDLNEALKTKNDIRVSVLRLLKTAVTKFEVSGDKKKEAGDEEILQIVAKEVKQRRESIEAFKKGSREDLAQKEEAEMKILQAYLPEQLSEEELEKIVKETIAELSVSSPQDFGKTMAAVIQKVKGKAQGNDVSQIVKRLLAPK